MKFTSSSPIFFKCFNIALPYKLFFLSFSQGSNLSHSGKHFFSFPRTMFPPSIAHCTHLFTSSHHVSRELITYLLCICSLLFIQENLFSFSARVLEENIWIRREEATRRWRSVIICTPKQTLLGWSNYEKNESSRTCNVTGKEQKYVNKVDMMSLKEETALDALS